MSFVDIRNGTSLGSISSVQSSFLSRPFPLMCTMKEAERYLCNILRTWSRYRGFCTEPPPIHVPKYETLCRPRMSTFDEYLVFPIKLPIRITCESHRKSVDITQSRDVC